MVNPPRAAKRPGMGPKAHVFDHQSEIWHVYMEEKDLLTRRLNHLWTKKRPFLGG